MNATKMTVFNGNNDVERFFKWANNHVDVVNMTKQYSGSHWVLDYVVSKTYKQLDVRNGDAIAYNGKELVNLSK